MTPAKAQMELEIARAYRSLFLNDDGSFKPEAETVLRDLERECGVAKTKMPIIKDGSVDPLRIVENFAKVAVFRHVKERLFAPLNNLVKATEK